MEPTQPPPIRVDDEYVLDSWRLQDAPAHRSFAEDEVAARFLGWSVEEARAQPDSHYVGVVRRFQDAWDTRSRLSLAIRRLATGEAVGAVELRPSGDVVEVSYLVAREFRARGVATRALTAFLDWAAQELGARRAVLSCRVDNLASQRVAAKCGFERIGRVGDELRFVRRLERH
jgi:RimJ/RimL family protein N-acetyltransferase